MELAVTRFRLDIHDVLRTRGTGQALIDETTGRNDIIGLYRFIPLPPAQKYSLDNYSCDSTLDTSLAAISPANSHSRSFEKIDSHSVLPQGNITFRAIRLPSVTRCRSR